MTNLNLCVDMTMVQQVARGPSNGSHQLDKPLCIHRLGDLQVKPSGGQNHCRKRCRMNRLFSRFAVLKIRKMHVCNNKKSLKKKTVDMFAPTINL